MPSEFFFKMFKKPLFQIKNSGLITRKYLFGIAHVHPRRVFSSAWRINPWIGRNTAKLETNLKVNASKFRSFSHEYWNPGQRRTFSLEMGRKSRNSAVPAPSKIADRLLKFKIQPPEPELARPKPTPEIKTVPKIAPKPAQEVRVITSVPKIPATFINHINRRLLSIAQENDNLNALPFSHSPTVDHFVPCRTNKIDLAPALIESPNHHLNIAYEFISNAFSNEALRLQQELVMINGCRRFSNWMCTLTIRWPQLKTFENKGNTKKETSHGAALLALQWLRSNERITSNGFPILVPNRNSSKNHAIAKLKDNIYIIPARRGYCTTTSNRKSGTQGDAASEIPKIVNPEEEKDLKPDQISLGSQERDIEHVRKLFPSPKNVLHNCFDILSKELESKNMKLQPSYSLVKDKVNNGHLWACAYNLKWPDVMKFSAFGRTKQDASNKAALVALSWLKRNEKITKSGQPMLVGKSEAKTLTKSLATNLNLDNYTQERIRDIIQKHQDQFLPHISNSLDQNNNEDYFESDEDNESLDSIELGPVRFNNKGKPRLLARHTYLAKEKVELPIAAYKGEFMDLLNDNRVVIVKGEPGCGKSTRIPQYVLESWIQDSEAREQLCRIAVTQPRRIAAISLAERVSNERNEQVGSIVGYQVRLKSNFKNATGRVLYCTNGILLRHFQSDPSLSGFSHVIIDEAHERDVNTDLLMNLLRTTLRVNPDLKVVVMSATIDTDMFSNYFDGAPVLHVPGFTHPVKPHFLDDVRDLDVHKSWKMSESDSPTVIHEDVANLIDFIHFTKGEGAILCFLPGWEDISKIQKMIPKSGDISVLCLHSRLQDAEQWKIFSRPPPGVRKVILSTNIAETSVTIDDVIYVIDTGIHKENRFDNDKGVLCVDNHWISQANMIQRKGRAGRVQPGESYHLYPKSKFEQFPKYTDPEILRTSLTKIVLDSKVYSNNMDARQFMNQLPCPPEESATMRAVQELKDLELLDELEKLTPLGKVLADFQLEPKLSKAMVNSVVYKCVTPVVDIVTIFSSETELFASGLTNRDEIKRIKGQFCQSSDHLALMRIFEKWLETAQEGNRQKLDKYCYDACIVPHKMGTLEKLRQIHFDYLCNGLNDCIPISDTHSDNDELVKAVILSGVGTMLHHRNWDIVKGRHKKTNAFYTNNNHKATITTESVNFKKTSFPSDYLMYINETRSNIRRTTLIRECSVVSPISVLLFSNKKLDIKDSDEEGKVILRLRNSKTEFILPKDQALAVVECKDALESAYQYFIFQMTQGGEVEPKVNKTWDSILKDLNSILTRHAVA